MPRKIKKCAPGTGPLVGRQTGTAHQNLHGPARLQGARERGVWCARRIGRRVPQARSEDHGDRAARWGTPVGIGTSEHHTSHRVAAAPTGSNDGMSRRLFGGLAEAPYVATRRPKPRYRPVRRRSGSGPATDRSCPGVAPPPHSRGDHPSWRYPPRPTTQARHPHPLPGFGPVRSPASLCAQKAAQRRRRPFRSARTRGGVSAPSQALSLPTQPSPIECKHPRHPLPSRSIRGTWPCILHREQQCGSDSSVGAAWSAVPCGQE